MELEVLRRCAI